MFERISAADNSKVKLIRKLQLKKHRDRDARFIAEGSNMIESALSHGAEIEFILADDELPASEIEAIDARAGGIVAPVEHRLFESLADAGHGASLLGVVKKPEFSDEDLETAFGGSNNVLVMDGVQDPGNFGTLVRTAAAAGYTAVIASKGTVDAWSPKALRATAGTIFELPVIYLDSAEAISGFAHRWGKRLIVSVPSGGRPYAEAGLGSGIALVVGNEGNGVSADMLKYTDELVSIPMAGEIESLNVAVSAGILMYEAIRPDNTPNQIK